MPRPRSFSRGSARAALLLVMIAAIGVAAVLLFRSSGGQAGPDSVGVGRSQDGFDPARTDPEGTGTLSRVEDRAAGAGAGNRAAAADGDGGDAGEPATVAAVDAATGDRIERFWVEIDIVADMTATRPRRMSDPDTALATVPLENGPAFAVVHAPAHAPTQLELRPGGHAIARMARATSLTGRVVDGSSAPLRAARVTLEYLRPLDAPTLEVDEDGNPLAARFPESYQGPTLRRTDDDGRFTFARLPAGVYRTRVAAGGAAQASAPVRVHAGGWTTSDHWLDEHIRIAVTVEAPGGAPAPRSRVTVMRDGAAGEPVVAGYTDTSGRATLGPVEAGRYQLQVLSDDGQHDPHPFTVPVDGPSIVDVHLVLMARSR